jgi:hypothetical protein
MRTWPTGRSLIAPSAGLLSLLLAARALAVVDCEIVCAPPSFTACSCVDGNPADACVITSLQSLTPGAVVDCDGIDIVLRDRIEVTNGVVTLHADDVSIDPGHRIEARRTQAGVPFGMILELTGSLWVAGVLEAQSDLGGGSVEVYALGDIVVGDASGGNGVMVNATGPDGDGGRILLASARDVTLSDVVSADGSQLGYSRGGEILVEADRHVTVRTLVSAFGHEVSGGAIDLVGANGTVDVQPCDACRVKAEGGGAQGDGGRIYLAGHRVVTAAPLRAQGGYGTGGGLSAGGSAHLDAAGGGIEIAGDIDVTSGEGGSGADGGAIIAESEGDLLVADGAHLTTKSDANGGDGGDIRLFARGGLTLGSATLDGRGEWGQGDEGTGATVEIEACVVTVGGGAVVDARGFDGGTVTVTAREALTVSAAAVFDTSAVGGLAGTSILEYRLPGRCSAGAPVGCTPGHCAPTGACSNDPARTCTVNGDCTVGCETGQCVRTCDNDPGASCTADTDCEPCASGQCVPNPDTGGTTTQFVPGPPELEANHTLQPCN